jgi:hypothetical protein
VAPSVTEASQRSQTINVGPSHEKNLQQRAAPCRPEFLGKGQRLGGQTTAFAGVTLRCYGKSTTLCRLADIMIAFRAAAVAALARSLVLAVKCLTVRVFLPVAA